MPGMDGLHATHRIRHIEALRPVPIVAVSASPFAKDQADARAALTTLFLSKPIEYECLLQEMGSLLLLGWIHKRPTSAHPVHDTQPLVIPMGEDVQRLHELARLETCEPSGRGPRSRRATQNIVRSLRIFKSGRQRSGPWPLPDWLKRT